MSTCCSTFATAVDSQDLLHRPSSCYKIKVADVWSYFRSAAEELMEESVSEMSKADAEVRQGFWRRVLLIAYLEFHDHLHSSNDV